MTEAGSHGPAPADKQFESTRVFDAPRDRVFGAYTECEHLPRWWEPIATPQETERL